jgi:two-component system OmpR family sensor kinase
MEEVERLTVLVEELLMLARIDAGLERGPAEIVSLNELAREIAQRFHSISKEKNIRIVVEPSPPVVATIGRGPADLVLANLLDNALKFSPAGTQVTVRIGQDDGAAIISVADAGPGIHAGESTRLFDRFYRGSAARAANAPGLGLGLALSQAIIQAHGGRIDASNGIHGGALFELRMPVWTPTALAGPSLHGD